MTVLQFLYPEAKESAASSCFEAYRLIADMLNNLGIKHKKESVMPGVIRLDCLADVPTPGLVAVLNQELRRLPSKEIAGPKGALGGGSTAYFHCLIPHDP